MKYTEFKKEIEALGLTVTNSGTRVYVETKDEETILGEVSTMTQYSMNIGVLLECYFTDDEYDKEAIVKLIHKLSITPIEEREDDEKYYLKIDGIVDSQCYLNYHSDSKRYDFDSNFETYEIETKFTDNDIKNLPEAFKKMIKIGVLKIVKAE